MYESHFGLRRRPFRAALDSDAYYPATQHERALARLLQAVADDEGLILLTGEPGTGKTLMCRHLLEQLGPDTTSAFLVHSRFRDAAGLLQAILYDLSVPYEGLGEQELRLKLTEFLLNNYGQGQRSVLVIDEAQHLSPGLLEELRLWGNLEARQGKALQVILAAQPGILQTIRRPELASFHQRLVVRVRLEPFSLHEAADYLVQQVRGAGGRPEKIFSDEALELLARGSGGVPRLLNQAAHQALSLAFESATTTVDAEVALEALALLDLSPEEEAEEPGPAAPAGRAEEAPVVVELSSLEDGPEGASAQNPPSADPDESSPPVTEARQSA